MIRLPFLPLASAMVAVLEVAYVACVAAGILWPDSVDAQRFLPTVLPGFTWLDPLSFVVGLVESALYGLAAAAVATTAWNFTAERTASAES